MKFNPTDADKVMLPEAWYDAEIMEAKEKTSSKGNEMLEVMYAVYAGASPEFVFDYFVTGHQSSMAMMKQCCSAIGLSKEFSAGNITPEMLKGKPIRLYIKTQKPKADSQYGPKNVAAKYASPDDPTVTTKPVASAAAADPDIPF